MSFLSFVSNHAIEGSIPSTGYQLVRSREQYSSLATGEYPLLQSP